MILQTAREGGVTLSPIDRKLAASLLGSENAITLLAQQIGYLVSLESLGQEKSAGCFPFRSIQGNAGYVLILLNHRRNLSPELVLRAQKRLEALIGSSQKFGFFDLAAEVASPGAATFPLPASPSQYLARPFGSLITGNGTNIWSWRVLNRRLILYCQASLLPPLESFGNRNQILLLTMIAFIGFLLVVQSRLQQRGVSIRIQIVFLFGLASLGSIASLTGFAGLYVEHRKSNLLREHSDAATEVLNQWDVTFKSFCRSRDQGYRKIVAEIAANLHDQAALAKTAQGIPGLGKKVSLLIVDTEGLELFSVTSAANMALRELFGETQSQTVREALKSSMQMYRLNKLSGKKKQEADLMAVSAQVERLSSHCRENLGVTRTLAVGEKSLIIFAEFIFDQKGLPLAAVFLTHQNRFRENEYLKEMSANPPPWCIAPFPFKVFSVSSSGAVHSKISSRLGGNVIHELDDSITQTQEPQVQSVSIAGEAGRFMLTGIPCRYLSKVRLFLISSLSQIEERSNRLIQVFTGFGILISLFGFTLSLVFSHMLLTPLRGITEGLNHLSAGTFSHRINIRTNDEMEELSSGLNKALEEMQELALARNIQEHLFPQGPLETPSCVCQGWSRSSSEIGGEIFDFQQVSGEKSAFWMAGVPGHSVSSALVLAMMKIAGRLFLSFGETSSFNWHDQLYKFIENKLATDNREYLCIGIFDSNDKVVNISMRGEFILASVCPGPDDSIEAVFYHGSQGADSLRRDHVIPLSPGTKLYLFSPGFLVNASQDHVEKFLTSFILRNKNLSAGVVGPQILGSLSSTASDGEIQTHSIVVLETR